MALRHPIRLASFLLASIFSLHAAPLPPQPLPLTLHQPVLAGLQGGQSVVFSVQATAGQFIHIISTQAGIDIEARLFAPGGAPVAYTDSLNALFGPEPVSAIATTPGVYKLVVTSTAPGAPAAHVRVELSELGPPSANDRARMAAEQQYMQGIQLYVAGDSKSLQSAVALWTANAQAYHTLGDPYGEALAIIASGFVRGRIADVARAADDDQRGMALALASGHPHLAVTAMPSLGDMFYRLGQQAQALEMYRHAVALAQRLGDHYTGSIAYNGLALALDQAGERETALAAYAQSQALSRSVGDELGTATSLNNIGGVYAELGQSQAALDAFQQALTVERALGDANAQGATLNSIGFVYARLHERDKALEAYRKSLPLVRAAGDRLSELTTLNDTGQLEVEAGQVEQGLADLQQALTLERAIGDRDGQTATLANLAEADDTLHKPESAAGLYQQALVLSWETGDVPQQALAFYDLMQHWQSAGEPALAILFGKQSVNVWQQLRRNIRGLSKEQQKTFLDTQASATYRQLAGLLVGQGRLPEAQQVLDLLKLDENAEFLHVRGAPDASSTAPVGFTATEATATADYEKTTADAVAVDQEWNVLDRKSERTAAEEARYRSLGAQVTANNAALDTYFTQLYARFGHGANGNRDVGAIQGETSALQEDLDPGSVALYTVVLDDRTVVMVITPTTRVARNIAVSRVTLQTKIFAFDSLLRQPHASLEATQKAGLNLYNLLFAPIASDVQAAQAQTLVWSLDGVLRYLPLAALYDGRQYLVERYRNAVITTAGVGDLRDAPHVSAASSTGLAMGVSNSYLGMPALPSVPSELDSVVHATAVKDSHGPIAGAILLNNDFTETAMEAALHRRPAIVHIASHYNFQVGDDTSYLLLGGASAGGGGAKLTLHDFANNPALRLDGVELLTLSACQSALGSNTSDRGQQDDGREIDGLGLEAQRKHAKAVIATLWDVNDRSTGQLMSAFYRNWLSTSGTSKSEALRQAQLSLLHGDYASPYYWAPFILIGNWK